MRHFREYRLHICELPVITDRERIGDGLYYHTFNMDFPDSYAEASARICCRLMNASKNRERLAYMPHRIILDLALVYYYRVDPAGESTARIHILNEHIAAWRVTEKELYHDAMENTQRLLPAHCTGISRMIRELSGDPEYLTENRREDAPGEADELMYVLTNSENCEGAICFLYPGAAAEIAAVLNGGFFILPSSIHECMIVPDSGQFAPCELRKMVQDINRQYVSEKEILSDEVYYYDKKAQVFTMEYQGISARHPSHVS